MSRGHAWCGDTGLVLRGGDPCCIVPQGYSGFGHQVTGDPLLSLVGGDNLYDGIEDMIGYRPGPWMKYSWAVITPALCVVSLTPA